VGKPVNRARKLAASAVLSLAAAVTPLAVVAAPFAATVAPQAQVRTLAGNGTAGNVDGMRGQAEFMFPTDVAVDKRNGDIYIADPGGQRIRKLAPDGRVTTVAGGGEPLPSGLDVAGGYVDGPALSARFNRPTGVAVGPDGAVYVADSFNHVIRKIAGGMVTTVAGNQKNPGGSDGDLKDATFLEPRAIAAGSDGSLYVADYTVGVRMISPAGLVSSLGFTGSDLYGLSLWEGPEFSVLFASSKYSVASYNFRDHGGGGLYSTAQRGSGVAPTGVVGLGPDLVAISSVTWQAVFFGKFSGAWSPYNGFSRLMVGPDEKDWQQKGGFADGPAAEAQVYDPMGMALDAQGNIILADAGNRRIRLLPAPDTRWALSKDDAVPAKAPGTYRIALVGDAGLFFHSMADDSIATDLQRLLERERDKNGLGARRVEVVTISLQSGDVTQQAEYILSKLQHGNVDAVVWALAPNAFDGYPHGQGGAYFADEPFVSNIFKHTAAKLQADGTALVLTVRPVASQVALDESTYSTYLGPGGGIDGGLQGYFETERYVDGLGVPSIAFAQRLADAERAAHVPYFDTDYGQFTPAGNELFAQVLGDGLSALHPWTASGAQAAH
jgi:hypothetical protein